MNGSTWSGSYALLPTIATQWRIAAAADFDGDGKTDLVWQNTTTGERSIWLMNGSVWNGSYAVLPAVSTQWSIAGVLGTLVWSSVSSGTANSLYGVWGSSASDVWAVGAIGTILHYNGVTWSSVSSGTSQGINGVWGSSAANVWAVGVSGTILHYSGTSWLTVSSGTTQYLYCVWGSS